MIGFTSSGKISSCLRHAPDPGIGQKCARWCPKGHSSGEDVQKFDWKFGIAVEVVAKGPQFDTKTKAR
eukprot:2014544-Amphidinium_carterae.2